MTLSCAPSDLLLDELEALRYTYGSELGYADSSQVSMVVHPHTGGNTDTQYVQAKLVLRPGEEYPSVSPFMQIVDAKGMSDVRLQHMRHKLDAEAEQMPGEMVLGHLFEMAKDYLTSINSPEGV